MQAKGIQSYRRTSVITADPKRLVLMCYEGAIDNLKLGKQKIIEKDYEAKGKALTKAQDIISELLRSLDFEKGGVIAKNLYSLYHFMLKMIMQANLKKDTKAIDDVIRMLEELNSAWEEVLYNQSRDVKPDPAELYEDRKQTLGYAGLQG